MKLVEQSVKYVQQKDGIQGIYDIIMECAKTCYQSEVKAGQDSKAFVDKLIRSGHLAMLEFGTVFLKIPILDLRNDTDLLAWRDTWDDCPWIKYNMDRSFMYVTTNMRYLWERDFWEDKILNYRIEPSKSYDKFPQRRCIRCNPSIIIVRELVRHRVFSFANESTRYCNYSNDKFNEEITCVKPHWFNGLNEDAQNAFKDALKQMEDFYFALLAKWENRKVDKRFKTGFKDNPLTPQQAREVLPLCTKSEICMCGFDVDWGHFFSLRLHGATGKPHPDMEDLAKKIFYQFCVNIEV